MLSSMTNSRQWTLRLVTTSATHVGCLCAAVGCAAARLQLLSRLHIEQKLEQHQRPMLTAHSVYLDFKDNDKRDAVIAMTDMLGSIMFPHLRQLEVRVGGLTEQRTTDSQWLAFGQCMAALEERDHIHTLRLHGMALPNPGLCSVLGHLPNVRTLSLPWCHVNGHNFASCLAPLTSMLRRLTHVEGYEEEGIVNLSADTLLSLRMPSVTHVSIASGAHSMDRLLTLFPGARHVKGNVYLDEVPPTPQLPDCTYLCIDVAKIQPAKLQLPVGSLPSLRHCMLKAILDDTPGRMVYIRNLLRQLLAAAPNMHQVDLAGLPDDAPSKLTPVRSLLLALAGERPINISIELCLSMDESKRCRQELNRALQPKGISFPRSTNAAGWYITVWRGCCIKVKATIWEPPSVSHC